jgi:hypothetical protein
LLCPGLEPVLREAVSRAYQSASGGAVPASFGVGNRRQSGSPVKPEETITETVDDVILRFKPWRGFQKMAGMVK